MGIGAKMPLKDSVASKLLVVVLGLYLLTATGVTLGNVWMEHRYQKANIIEDMRDIQHAFEHGLAVSLWGLDEKSLRASVGGMLRIPTLVGVEITTDEEGTVAIGGIVTAHGEAGYVGLHVDLSGVSAEYTSVHPGEASGLEMYEHHFPIIYALEGEDVQLGRATIYSDSSVIQRRMKLQGAMLAVNVLLTLLTFSVALLWAVNHYLRRPLGLLTSATASISLSRLGSFSVDTKTSGHNEIKVLEEAITTMVADLHEAVVRRAEMEKAKRQSEEHLQAILDNTSAVVYLKDTKGSFLTINRRFEELFHISRQEIIGKTDHDVFPSDKASAFVANDRLVAEKGAAVQIEEVAPHDDGDHTYISVKFPLYDDADTLYAVGGISTDITDRKQVETEREVLIEELAAKNAELERFTYTVSHDLKSPLITINGFLGYLQESALAGNVERTRSDIGRINDAVENMRQLLDDLLELSRIGHVVSPPELVSFSELAQEAVSLVAGRVAARGVEVIIAPDLPIVHGDRVRLREVVQNLVENAIKFMGDQRHPRIDIGVRYDGPAKRFFVKDNGVGIDPVYCEKIFGLFDRLDHEAEGTGVGLALVKRIVEMHGGRVWVESEGPGTGCTFYWDFGESSELPG